MESTNIKSKRPSLLSPVDLPQKQGHEPDDTISLSDIQSDQPQQRRHHSIAPWIVGAICLLLLFVGITLWPVGNNRTPAASKVVQRHVEETMVARQTPPVAAAPKNDTTTLENQRSVATIISYTKPTNGRSIQPSNSAVPSLSSTKAIGDNIRISENDKLNRNAGSVRATESLLAKAAPTLADTPTFAPAASRADRNGQNLSVVHMPEIDVLGAVPDKPQTDEHADTTNPINADIAILAMLMSYIETQDTQPTSNTTMTYSGMETGNTTPVLLQHRLHNCAPANTVKGIRCRQNICRGYVGKIAACPAPKRAKR